MFPQTIMWLVMLAVLDHPDFSNNYLITETFTYYLVK